VWEDIILSKRIRLLGVDTPELRPRKGTDEEKAAEKIAAKKASEFVRSKLSTGKLQFLYVGKSDSFGRALGSVIYVSDGKNVDIRDALRAAGHLVD